MNRPAVPFWQRPGFNPFEGCTNLGTHVTQPVYCIARQNHLRWGAPARAIAWPPPKR